MTSDSTPAADSVSVIVTVTDPTNLADSLAAVRGQDCAPIEVFVVGEQPVTALPALGDAHYIQDSAQSGRAAGLARSLGAWVLWLDSDQVLPQSALSILLGTAEMSGADAVRFAERIQGKGYWAAAKALEMSVVADDPASHVFGLVSRSLAESLVAEAAATHAELSDASIVSSGARIASAPLVVDRRVGALKPTTTLAMPHPGIGTVAASMWRHRAMVARKPSAAIGAVALRGVGKVSTAVQSGKRTTES